MMKRCLLSLATVLALATLSRTLHAQALPTATRGGFLQGGLTVSNASTDELDKRISGISGYSTFDFTPHLGVEVDLHFLNLLTPEDYGQKSYMVGVRYVYRKNNFEPYGKLLAGIASTVAQEPYVSRSTPGTPGSYGAFAFGAGVDYRLPHHVNVRVFDFEYQKWPGFGQHGLSPSIISIGAAYRFR